MTLRPDYPADLLARAARIKLACFDVDGTLTDGRLIFDSEGRELKAFHSMDGQGLALLRKAGIEVAFITARKSHIVELRAKELGAQARTGIHDKLAVVRELCGNLGIGLDEASFMGDDIVDRQAMQAVGLAVAPANAHAWTADVAHWQTNGTGGMGAARELCDLILHAQGRVDALLQARQP